MVLRDAADGPEVLLLRRKSGLAFYGGAWVFPGGGIDAVDREPREGEGSGTAAAGLTLAARRAAARELREEAGLLLAPEALSHFAQWLTPPGRTRRFDTWFFVADAAQLTNTPHQELTLDAGEIDGFRWLTPPAALQARARKEIELPPPTFVTLTLLAAHACVADAIAALRLHAVRDYTPRPCAIEAAGLLVHLYRGDAGFDTQDPGLAGPRHRLIVRGENWIYESSELAPQKPVR